MIALIDYDIGNLRSAEKAVQKAGGDIVRATSPELLENAAGAVLPGVGAFGDCVTALERRGLTAAVKRFIASGKPFLGICVGMQMLFAKGYENGVHDGLGIFDGSVNLFHAPGLKVPQIGWNRVRQQRPDCPLFREIPDETYFYFVHSYAVRPEDPSVAAGVTTYGEVYPSIVWRGNVFGTQFHPEKSQQAGLQLLRNFVGLCR